MTKNDKYHNVDEYKEYYTLELHRNKLVSEWTAIWLASAIWFFGGSVLTTNYLIRLGNDPYLNPGIEAYFILIVSSLFYSGLLIKVQFWAWVSVWYLIPYHSANSYKYLLNLPTLFTLLWFAYICHMTMGLSGFIIAYVLINNLGFNIYNRWLLKTNRHKHLCHHRVVSNQFNKNDSLDIA